MMKKLCRQAIVQDVLILIGIYNSFVCAYISILLHRYIVTLLRYVSIEIKQLGLLTHLLTSTFMTLIARTGIGTLRCTSSMDF